MTRRNTSIHRGKNRGNYYEKTEKDMRHIVQIVKVSKKETMSLGKY